MSVRCPMCDGSGVSRHPCPLEFRGAMCRYEGGERSCDKSWKRCREIGNQDRFLGFGPERCRSCSGTGWRRK